MWKVLLLIGISRLAADFRAYSASTWDFRQDFKLLNRAPGPSDRVSLGASDVTPS
jgi:hypothetical protein